MFGPCEHEGMVAMETPILEGGVQPGSRCDKTDLGY